VLTQPLARARKVCFQARVVLNWWRFLSLFPIYWVEDAVPLLAAFVVGADA